MTVFPLRRMQLALQIGHRTRLGRRRSPPSGGGDQASPGVKQAGGDAQLLPHHLSGLATIEPVLNCLAFESFVEFPALSDRCLFHRSDRSLFTQSSVRQFEVPTDLISLKGAVRFEIIIIQSR